MPFVRRNPDGSVAAVFAEPEEDGLEEVSPDDPAIRAWLCAECPQTTDDPEWVKSDLSMVRVLEDVIDVLVGRGVFQFNDLPEPAQRKLLDRRSLRTRMDYLAGLFPDGAEDPE
jgi:hypothetical protein